MIVIKMRIRNLFWYILFFCCSATSALTQPNFIVIVSDDQRADILGKYMPIVQERIFNEGVTFENAYVTTPACCPSRSSIMTGMCASKHGVLLNRMYLEGHNILHKMQSGGYYTGLIGKYLNTWDGSKRPEADYWVAFPHGSSRYFNPLLNVQGEWHHIPGYMTHILGNFAVDFIDNAVVSGKPFFLLFTPNAPHAPFHPAPEDVGRWADEPLPEAPSRRIVNERGKPSWVKPRQRDWRKSRIDRRFSRSFERIARAQLAMLWSLDKAVGSILTRLENHGILDSTVVIYISDNGLMWGEHWLTSKDCVYEEATKVPLALRYPPLVPEPRVVGDLAANIDILPTVLDLANLPIPEILDGLSLKDLLEGYVDRDFLLLEGFRTKGPRAPFVALHGERYVYVLNKDDRAELYDLASDPFQLNNLMYTGGNRILARSLESTLLEGITNIREPGSEAFKAYMPKRLNPH